MQSLIAWLSGYSWHQLLTMAPVSVLGHSWPIFFLFLPVQSCLFTLLWAEFLLRPVSKTPKGCQYFRSVPRILHAELYCLIVVNREETLDRYGLLGRSDQTPPGALHWREHTCHHIDSTWSVCQRVFRSLSLSLSLSIFRHLHGTTARCQLDPSGARMLHHGAARRPLSIALCLPCHPPHRQRHCLFWVALKKISPITPRSHPNPATSWLYGNGTKRSILIRILRPAFIQQIPMR